MADLVLGLILLGLLGVWYFNGYNKNNNVSNVPVVQESMEPLAPSEEPVVEPSALPTPEPTPEPQPQPVTIVFTGDVELSDYVRPNYDRSGILGVVDEGLLEVLSNADITMVNNEFCYSLRGEQAPDKQFTFRVDPSYVNVLKDMGVDVAGIANNHVLDFGKDALEDTIATLDEAGIAHTGAGFSLDEASKGVVLEAEGLRIGFLAASRVIPTYSWNVVSSKPGLFCTYDPADFFRRIKELKEDEGCDYVFAFVHWGKERTLDLEDHQVMIGHGLIDAGADAVIGMHSHCLQPVEYYKDRPIFYSLGNFIFNQTIEKTAIVRVTLPAAGDVNTAVDYELLPCKASSAKTVLLTGDDAKRVLDYIEEISR